MVDKTKEYRKISYWEIVWSQFKKKKLAMSGLICIAGLFLIAIFAPVLSFNKPFFIYTSKGFSFPFFVNLFDRNIFENGVDIFFNTLLCTTSIFIIVLFLRKLVSKKLNLKLRWLAVSYVLLTFIAYIFLMVNPYRAPYQNYHEVIKKYEKSGKKLSYLFPIYQYSYREIDNTGNHPQQPSLKNLFGTDEQGRDVFARMVYGTRISLTIGVVAVSIYITIGITLGAIAGYFGGKIDLIISRIIEVMLCFPVFFIILTIAGFIENRSIFHIMLIIGLTRWTSPARLVRAEFLKQKNMDYAQAAIALGFSKFKIIFTEILPNAIAPVLVTATFGVASAILVESTLSFLGLGDPTVPSWGEILTIGRVQQQLHLIMIPGLAIFFVVSVFNLVGEGLRDALDPKLKS